MPCPFVRGLGMPCHVGLVEGSDGDDYRGRGGDGGQEDVGDEGAKTPPTFFASLGHDLGSPRTLLQDGVDSEAGFRVGGSVAVA